MSSNYLPVTVLVLLAALLGAAANSSRSQGDDLFRTVQDNQLENVKRLLKRGTNVNARDEQGATALMHAAVYGSPEVMKALLDKGANPNIANGAGSTALM